MAQALARVAHLVRSGVEPSTILVISAGSVAKRRLEAVADAHWLPFGCVGVRFTSAYAWASATFRALGRPAGDGVGQCGNARVETKGVDVESRPPVRVIGMDEATVLLARHFAELPLPPSNPTPAMTRRAVSETRRLFNAAQVLGV